MRATIKPITPKRAPIDIRAYEQAVEEALDETAAQSLADYQKTVNTWTTAVNFTVNKTQYGRSVGTRNKIFGYVDQGTEGHYIRARHAPYLVFRGGPGRRAKTKPHTLASYNGKPGEDWARRKSVWHPGTQARLFTQVINTRNKSRFAKNLRAALKRAKG